MFCSIEGTNGCFSFSICAYYIDGFHNQQSVPYYFVICDEIDLRDDKQFCIDHPGAVPITTAQVSIVLGALESCLVI